RDAARVDAAIGDRIIPLRPADFLDGRLRLLVPAEFHPMSPELIRIKYPSARRPQEVLSNDDGTVTIAVSHTPTRVTPTQLPSLFRMMSSQLEQANPRARWFQSETGTINGRSFFLLDFRTPAADTNIRNVMLGTSFQGRLVLVSFNMIEALEDEWMPVGNKIIASLQLK
ncbi:MAG: hypothetical protein HKO59_12645, partial [Phycisphaerales bacterium]|nr:hypothetical protein [Phycisphaerae bacterium]NNM26811.1 hypothetical protein [Phycisphaerales bacterium]